MPNWKKVILSGSNAVLNQITASSVPGSSTNVEDLIAYDATTGGFVTIAQNQLGAIEDSDWHIQGAVGTGFLTASRNVLITGSITSSGGARFADGGAIIEQFDGAVSEIFVDGHITASNNISASGLLFISTSEVPAQNYKVLVQDTATGRVYRTGSYSVGGGGGTGTPGGSDHHIQFNNASAFGGDNRLTFFNNGNAIDLVNPDASVFRHGASVPAGAGGAQGDANQSATSNVFSGSFVHADGGAELMNARVLGNSFETIVFTGFGTKASVTTALGTYGVEPISEYLGAAVDQGQSGTTSEYGLPTDGIQAASMVGKTVPGEQTISQFYGAAQNGLIRVYAHGFGTIPGSPGLMLDGNGLQIYPSASCEYDQFGSGSFITPLASASGRITLTETSNPANSTFDIIGRKNTQFQTGESGSVGNYMIYNSASDVIGLGGKGLTVSDLSNTSSAADKIYFHDPLTANSAVSFKQNVNFTPTVFNSAIGNNNTIYLAGNIGNRQGTLATYPNNKQRFTPRVSYTLSGGGNPGGGGSGRPFFDIEDSDLQIAKSGSEDVKGGILLTPNPNIFFFNETDASASISGSLIPDSASAQIKFDTGSSALKFFAGSTTETLREVLHISKSGDNPRIGIGTSNPIKAFDFKEVRDDNRGGELLIRGSRTTKGAENNDEVGRINFAIDSASFGRIDTSGSAAEIVAIVDDIDPTGVEGSLSLRVASAKTAESVQRIKLIGNPSSPAVEFTGSTAFDTDVTIGDDLTVSDFALLNSARIGSTATDPGDGVLYVEDYGVFVGGLKVGSSEDPGANNLIVDGTTTLKGISNIGNQITDTLIVSASNVDFPSVVEKSTVSTTDNILILEGDRVKQTPQSGLPYVTTLDDGGGVAPNGGIAMFTGSGGKTIIDAPGITYNATSGLNLASVGSFTDLTAGSAIIGTLLGSVSVTGNITASGNISASGQLLAEAGPTINTTLVSDSATNIDTFNTSSNNGAIYDYTLFSAPSGARAGQCMVIHHNGNTDFTDTSTPTLGSETSIPFFETTVNGANVEVKIASGSGYTFKAFVKKL